METIRRKTSFWIQAAGQQTKWFKLIERVDEARQDLILALTYFPFDVHLTLHSQEPGQLHLKQGRELITKLELPAFKRELRALQEKLRSDLRALVGIYMWIARNTAYHPKHNRKVLAIGSEGGFEEQFISTTEGSILFDLDSVIEDPLKHCWHEEISPQQLRRFATVVFEQLRVNEFLLFDNYEKAVVAVNHQSPAQVRAFSFPFDYSDLEKTSAYISQLVYKLISVLPSLYRFTKEARKYLDEVNS